MRRLLHRATQSAVGWSLVATTLRFGSALFILPLVLRNIPPDELGLWYVFLSLGALAGLLDFGVAPTVIRSTAYLWAGARKLLPFGVECVPPPDALSARPAAEPNLPMLADLVASLRLYYRGAGLLVFALLVSGGGAWIWHKSAALADATSLRLAFLVYAAGVALNFINGVWVSLLQGANRIRTAQQITVMCLMVYYVLAVTGLLLGFRLWALVISTFVMGVLERVLGRISFNRHAGLPRGKFDRHILGVLWPNAWRTGAVAAGGFMIIQANTLICSAFLDLPTTASYGLSMQGVTLLVGISSVWVTVKLPIIHQLRARGREHEIAQLFRQRIVLAIASYVVGAIGLIWLAPPLLEMLRARTHLLPTALLLTLVVIQLLEMHHSLYAGLVYSENHNPFLKPAVISGVAIVCLSVFLTPRIGVWGMLLAAGGVQLAFNNWWPVLRAVRGLGDAANGYWRGFLRVRRS